jgi:galactokinase
MIGATEVRELFEVEAGARDAELLSRRMQAVFGTNPADIRVVRSPYRICPLGAHVDHQQGEVSGLALDRGILLAFAPSRQPRVRMLSYNFPGRVELSYDNVMPARAGYWGNYVQGAVQALQQRNMLATGLDGVVLGELPTGGISSSAALGVACLLALEAVNGLDGISPAENIALDSYIENSYLGVDNGILDQSMILLGRAGCLTYLDCRSREHRHVKLGGDPARLALLLCHSGVTASLIDTDYNRHVAECREAAALLLRRAGLPVPQAPVLRDVEPEVFSEIGSQLPPHLQRRAQHYFSEIARVRAGIELWRKGELTQLGRLVNESGYSSINSYGCGCPELISLYQILSATDGVYGARFSGAGYRGFCLALVDAEHSEAIHSAVREQYLRQYPERKQNFALFTCRSSSGAEVIGASR